MSPRDVVIDSLEFRMPVCIPWAWTSLVLLLLIVAMFAGLTAFYYPSGGDWDFAELITGRSFLQGQRIMYNTWAGRFTATAMVTAATAWEFRFTKIWLALNFVLHLLAVYYLISTLTARYLRRPEVWLLATFLMVIHLTTMLSPYEGFYWLCSAFTYESSAVLAIFLLAILLRSWPQGRCSRIGLFVLCAIIAGAVAGSNETMAVTLGILLLARLLWLTLHRDQRRWPWLVSLVFLAIGFTISYRAPGNAIRQDYFNQAHQLIPSIQGTFRLTFILLREWFDQPLVIVATLLWLLVVWWAGLFRSWRRPILYIVIPPLGIILMAASAFPPFWAMNASPGYRTINILQLILMFWWFACVTLIAVNLPRRLATSTAVSRTQLCLALAGLLVFLVSLWAQPNFREALWLWTGPAWKYRQQTRQRIALVKEALSNNVPDLQVPPFRDPPRILWAPELDITEDPKDWRNRCFAAYWKLQSVKVALDNQ